MKTSRKKICRICFAIVLALIMVLYCIMCCLEGLRIIEHCRETHDRLNLVFWKLDLLLVLANVIVLTIQELVLYKGVCYFMGMKAHTRGKNWVYIVLLFADLALFLYEVVNYLPEYLELLAWAIERGG